MKFKKLVRKNFRAEDRRYFNEIASQWDTMSKEFYSDSLRQKIISLINPEPGIIIADIGAGTGFISEGLKDSPASIIAIDQSKKMLNQMKIKFQDSSKFDYRKGDANHLPAIDNLVDYALVNMYLHHVDDPPRAITEIYRILNRGGVLVLTDLNAHNFEYLKEEDHDKWLGFTNSDIKKWLFEAGFTNVSVDPIDEYCCTESETTNNKAEISIFLARGEKHY